MDFIIFPKFFPKYLVLDKHEIKYLFSNSTSCYSFLSAVINNEAYHEPHFRKRVTVLVDNQIMRY